MAVTIQIRRDEAADWTTANPVLALGELGFEMDTGQQKVGDGLTAWNDLPYWGGGGGGDVPTGTIDGQVMRWNQTAGAWELAAGVIIDAAGNITSVGTVDGRDVSLDGSNQDTHIADTGIHFADAPVDATPRVRLDGAWVDGVEVLNDSAKRIEVVASLPGTPDAETIYFVTS